MVPLTFLVASPHVSGGMFERSVVLLLEHDHTGAMGLIMNVPTELALKDILPVRPQCQAHAWVGGPVEPQVGWCVYERSTGMHSELRLADGLYVTSSQDVLEAVIRAGGRFMLMLGYAGWAPAQLDAELREGGWLWVDGGPELVFSTPAEERWEAAMRLIGVNPSTIMPGGAQA